MGWFAWTKDNSAVFMAPCLHEVVTTEEKCSTPGMAHTSAVAILADQLAISPRLNGNRVEADSANSWRWPVPCSGNPRLWAAKFSGGSSFQRGRWMRSDPSKLIDPLTGTPAVVRAVQPYQATKRYTCPGCNQNLERGTGHVVVIPEFDADLRRHWHHGCWEARHRRRLR